MARAPVNETGMAVRAGAAHADAGREAKPGAEEDARWMRRAIALAERGWGRVSPNPLVGAVVVREGRAVGEGWHAELGAPHAEAVALRAAGPAARGGTLYVTLEPCRHHGRTPPCTEVVLASGVRRVVIACRDPHPEAAGGAARLRAGGLQVDVGVEAMAACRTNAAFLWRHARGLPLGSLKLALSLDAKLARRPGERSAVTGPAAWREVHRLRAGHDAVLVGRRTAQVDDPRLTARSETPPLRPPIRLVADADLRLSPEARLVRTARRAPTWVLGAPDADPERRAALEERGVRVLEVARGPGGIELTDAWRLLAAEGLTSVLAEGGGRIASSLLDAGLVLRLHLLYAPVLFGSEGVPAFPAPSAAAVGTSSRVLGGAPPSPAPGGGAGWRPVRRRPLGRDTLLVLERPELAELASELGA